MVERIPEDPASQVDNFASIAEHMSDTGVDAVQPRNKLSDTPDTDESAELLQANLGPEGIKRVNGTPPRSIMTQGLGGEPWRKYWPPVAKTAIDNVEDKPWIGWTPNPDKPGERPWLVWMNDPKYVRVPNKSY